MHFVQLYFNRRRIIFLSFIVFLFFSAGSIQAAEVMLAWDNENTTDVGFHLYMRTEGNAYDYTAPIWSGADTTCTVKNLDENVYYFVARAYAAQIESVDSNEVEYKVIVNEPPVADAGTDQAVSEGTRVSLDGSGSTDSDGAISNYQWTQTSGPSVTLSSITGSQTTFTAPNITESTDLSFQLAVTDDGGLSNSDTCIVNVLPVAPADSDDDGLTDEEETDIYGTDPYNSDSDGDGVPDGQEVISGTDPITNDNEYVTTAEVIIVDNGSTGTYSTGSWRDSGGTDYFESKSVYSKEAGATYTFEAPVGGSYTVSMWWTYWASRGIDVPIEIYDGTQLLDTVYVDQTENGGRFNDLGTYNFTDIARIVIVSEGNCSTNADAVRLIPASISIPSESDSITIDNGSTGTYSTGSWRDSGGTDYFENKSVYSKEVGATYTFEAPVGGSYTVSMWWTYWASRCIDVPIEIYDGTQLLDTVYVDQTDNGGQWNEFGTYDFTGIARIAVVSEGDCSTCADAVKFVAK